MKHSFVLLLIAYLFTACSNKEIDLSPAITSFSPESGMVGATVTITGSNLSGVTSVKFNGVAAPGFNTTATSITVQVPANATTGSITVSSPDGTTSSSNAFTVIPTPLPKPEITSFTPASGGAGTSVTITGTNLSGVTSVKFNGVEAPGFNATGTSITVAVPANATTGTILVTSPGGTATSSTSFTVLPPPVIVSSWPSSNAVNGPVMIEGNFQEISDIKFNSVSAPVETLVTGTTLLNDLAILIDANVNGIVTTKVPAGLTPGQVNLTIVNKNGTSSIFKFSVLAAAPAIPISPGTFQVKKKARYIPVIQNYWTNELNSANFIFVTKDGTQYLGNENLTGPQSNFVVTKQPSLTDTKDPYVEITVTNPDNSKEKLSGIYADSDVLPADNPATQRIIFYNKDGRQIMVHVNVR